LILLQAVVVKASDVHFEAFENEFRVRYRIDGVLHEKIPVLVLFANGIISRIKVMANLDIPLILGTADYPEGRAKIERFNSTVTQDVLRGLTKPEIDPACSSLELRLRHYCQKRYNLREHNGINNISPATAFNNDSRSLRHPYDEEQLRRAFYITSQPKVSRHNVINFRKKMLEVPLGYTGKRITIYRDVLSDSVYMLHEGQYIQLMPADLGANARERRAPSRKKKRTKKEPPIGPITTAAEMHFNRDYSPIVDEDGGFVSPPHKQTED